MILIYLEDPAKALGLEEGDAHVIRSAGGRAVDAIRSLVISQLFFFFFWIPDWTDVQHFLFFNLVLALVKIY